MKNKAAYIILLATVLTCFGQQEELTLDRAIGMALENSPRIESAIHNYRRSYWQYRTYRAGYLPRLYLSGTVPSLSRQISSVTQGDGTETFVEQSNAISNAELSLRQRFGLTGGEFFVSSGLSRIDILSDPESRSYKADPISVGFSQPLFAYNSWRWDRKIEPQEYKTSQLRLVEDIEDTKMATVERYFDLLIAQIELNISEINRRNNDTLYLISEGRYNLGKIARNELLQMELSMLSARSNYESSLLSLRSQDASLKSFLRMDTDISLTIPETQFEGNVDPEHATEMALEYGTQNRELDTRLISAERDIAMARGQSGPDVNLYMSYGLSSTAEDIEDVYTDPTDNQTLSLGISIPIYDGGEGRGRVSLQRSSFELVRSEVEQARTDLVREIELLVAEYNNLPKKLAIAAKSDTVAQLRYEVARQRYLIGKIGITDLNIAQQERDSARRSYISDLRSSWLLHFRLRKLTHMDPKTGELISIDEYPDI